MKVIKKITAIMLSIMMVLGMSSVVSAAGTTTSGTSSTVKGKITISNAIPGQTYNIYKILDLESYDATDPNNEHYAYKAVSEWKTFLTGTEIKGTYVDVDSDGYVTWKTDADAVGFAKKALAYAKDTTTTPPITAMSTKTATTTTVEFTDLDSGYYLVDSSVGTLCFLDTMKSGEVTIAEKNVAPTVKKEVQEDSKKNTANEYGDTNTADIGDTVNFKTTITAQAGAQNYVLHDKMDAGLTFDDTAVNVQKNGTNVGATNYTLNTATTDGCTFELVFAQGFCDTLNASDTITVEYSATLNKQAKVGTSGNTNKTWLMYGENPGIKSNEDSTTTFTYKIPVFKYTGSDQGLAGAKFQLNRVEGTTGTLIKVVKTSEENATEEIYRVATTTEQSAALDTVTTIASGKFTIEGLDAGTYELKETQQPAGYNKLSKAVKIVIAENGNIFVDDGTSSTSLVKVENKSGSLLPSTGGRGTTLFYILGAILVVGSGVVLITKKRMK